MNRDEKGTDRQKFVIFVAGGQGLRMGGGKPKQFLEIGGKAILHRTLEQFAAACPGIRMITVLPNEHIAGWKEYCTRRSLPFPQILVAGGITRFHSVRNALAKVPEGVTVAIHDGVRPFVSAGLIRRMFDEIGRCRALIPVLPCYDTLKALRQAEDGSLELIPGATVNRSEIWCAQTPQLFRSSDIKAAYREAFDTAFTDDASVAARSGIPLSFTLGEKRNLKITDPEDLALAEAILRCS